MGNFRVRVKNSKGKRWIKGHSSASNPSCKKFRNSVRSSSHIVNKGTKTILTAETLRQHENKTGSMDVKRSGSESGATNFSTNVTDNVSLISGVTSRTAKTFASDWSECSNLTFGRLLNRFNLSSAFHKEMLAVLAAVTEVIKANGGTENTTEYFAALMTVLESSREDADDSTCAILSLLAMCIKSVPRAVLQLKFDSICKTFMRHMRAHAESDNNVLLKSLIGCLSVLLRAQSRNVWNDSSTVAAYDAILAFILHTKAKIRKAAQHAVCAILKASLFMDDDKEWIIHPVASHTAKHCVSVLENSTSEGAVTSILRMFTLLQEILCLFPKTELKSCCETILKLMTLPDPLIKSCGFEVLHFMFKCRPKSVCCPVELNERIVNALHEYRPSEHDEQLTLAWLVAMQEAFLNLAANDLARCMANLPLLFSTGCALFLSTSLRVIDHAALLLDALLKECVASAALPLSVHLYEHGIGKMHESLAACVQYRYHPAWKQILHVLSTFYKVCGKTCGDFLIESLEQLAALRDSEEFPYNNELEHAFKLAVETIGPEKISRNIPLQICQPNNIKFEVKRSWLLPVYREGIKGSTLRCFVDNFLPMATFFRNTMAVKYAKLICLNYQQGCARSLPLRNKSEELRKMNENAGAVTYELLMLQIWALFPSFSNKPTDISETFPSMAKALGGILSTKKELRATVMIGLRRLVSSSLDNEDDTKTMARFAKNYLPILFNLYTTQVKGTDETADRFAAFDTIKIYLTISDPELQNEMFDRALQKLDSEEAANSSFTKETVLDLIRVLMPYQSCSSLSLLYERHISKLKEPIDFKEEKKYYRLLEDLCSSVSEGCSTFIQDNMQDIKNLLLNSLTKTAVTSRGPRMRCLIHLLEYDCNPETILENVPEAVLCCKDTNKRCRESAFNLVRKMAHKMVAQGEAEWGRYLDAVTAGLAGSPSMIAATIVALACLFHDSKEHILHEQFNVTLNNMCILVKSPTREIVGPALGFIKLIITTYPADCVLKNLQLIVKTLSGVTEDCKRRYRQKLRDIYERLRRKCGYDAVVANVPTHDGATLLRLKALQKLDNRKKRKREDARKQKGGDASSEDMFSVKAKPKTMDEILAECDDDDDDDDNVSENESKNERRAKKSSVYLQEDADSIIDFTSKSAFRSITTAKPNDSRNMNVLCKNKTQTGFKTTPDGRLIISEPKEEKVPKKIEINSDEEDIASDADADAEGNLTALLNDISINRKRKIGSNKSDENEPLSKYRAGGSGIHRNLKGTKDKNTRGVRSGAEFKSKKSKGDVKKKGKPDPFAYIPLSRNSLNKRKRKKAAGQFKSIVVSAKKGARKGSLKINRSSKKNCKN